MNFISNINTYISYTCVPLTETNYNEVDALIFARLSYFPFERIFVNYKKIRITLTEFTRRIMEQPDFFNVYSEDERIFIKKLAGSRRYYHCIIYRMQAVNTEDTQWAAYSLDIGNSGVSVIAMRGTDGTAVGWREDFRLAHNRLGTGAQLQAFRYLKNTDAKRIYLTGHSKGGSNVSSAYVMCNSYIRDKVVRIDNFDGPGVNPEFAGNYADGYRELGTKMNNFYPQDSIIGLLLLDNPGVVFFIKSVVGEAYARNPVFGQHDPFSWVVNGNGFVKAEQTGASEFGNQILDDVVVETTNLQRYYLIQFLERVGLPDIIAGENTGIAQSIAKAICGLVKAPKEEKAAVFQIILIFIKRFIYSMKEGLHIGKREDIIELSCE